MKNGWKNNKRIKLAVFCVLAAALFAGYIFYKPKLINAPKPFIELSGTVGTAVGNAQYVKDHPSPTPAGNDSLTPTPTPVPTLNPTPTITPTPVPDNKVTIRVEDTSIYIDKVLCTDVDDAGRRLKNRLTDASVITLVDDYAELKTYRSVMKLLKSLGISNYSKSRID